MTQYVYQARVRWADLDAQGHVNNVSFLDFMQEARVDWLVSGPQAQMLGEGVLVVGHHIEYLAQATFSDEPIIIWMWVTDLGAAKFGVAYHIHQGDSMVARARTSCARYDVDAGRLRRVSAAERSWLEEFAGPRLDFRPLPTSPVRWAPGLGYEFPLRVRWSELDPYGHVNNVSFLTYLQEAHIAMMDEARRDLPWGGREDARTWVIAAQDITYKAPMAYRIEPYACDVVVLRVGSSSITFEMRIRDPHTDTTHAIGHQVLVHADKHGIPVPIPAVLRERLRPLTLNR